MCLSVDLDETNRIGYRTVMRGSRNFRQVGCPGQSDKKADNLVFSPQLILQKANG